MAVDTAAKRASALAMTLPIPDGTIDQGDRQHVLWTYGGVLAALLVTVYPTLHATITLSPWIHGTVDLNGADL